MNRQIRSLARAVNGEKAETNGANVVKMREGMTEKFARRFGRGIRRNRFENFIVFGERNF